MYEEFFERVDGRLRASTDYCCIGTDGIGAEGGEVRGKMHGWVTVGGWDVLVLRFSEGVSG